MPRKTNLPIVNSGLHAPNCFIVPFDIIEISHKLNKEAILSLLYILAQHPEKATDKGVEELKSCSILNLMGELIWEQSIAPIKLVKDTRKLYEGISKENIDANVLFDSFPSRVKDLYPYYQKSLVAYGINVNESHKINWSIKISEMLDHPNFGLALDKAHQSHIGHPKWISAVLNSRSSSENTNPDVYDSWENK